MARIYPQWISDADRQENPGRRAEYLVYDALATQLSDEWLVLYSQAIKWGHQYGVSDREADFIVAHPKLGVLMLEVKGGSISRRGSTWYTTPLRQATLPESQQNKYKIKNPYEQATNAAYSYQRKLDDYVLSQPHGKTPRLPKRQFKICTAVCFPDVDLPPNTHLSGDALPELTLSQRDLPHLKDRLYEIFKFYQGKSGAVPGKEGISLLRTVLARDWHIPAYLANQFQVADNHQKQILTEEQFRLFSAFDYNPKMLVAGCAGSGKTMLATQKAIDLARQGCQVLFTCYNRQLAEWLQTILQTHTNITVAHFHDLCRHYAKQASQVNLPDWSVSLGTSRHAYYNETMPESLGLAAIELDLAFDAIIVDEGQDFNSSWLQVLHDHLLKNSSESNFYLFFDDNQRVYSQSQKMPFEWPVAPLSKNMRNTDPIFDFVRQYHHHPKKIKPSGVTGPEPQIIPITKPPEQLLQDTLAHLMEEQISLDDIAILTPKPRQQSLWGQIRFKAEEIVPVWHLSPGANQVTCSSIRTFKGLERSVIILTELDRLEPYEIQDLLYVGISRAKHHLIIIGDLPTLEDNDESEYY